MVANTKWGKGGKNLRPQFGLLLGTLGSWKYCVEAGSLWNYRLGSHSCCVNSYHSHLPPTPRASIFFFNSLISRLSSCKAIQRWEPERVGALALGAGNAQVLQVHQCSHLLLTSAGLKHRPGFGRLLPSGSELPLCISGMAVVEPGWCGEQNRQSLTAVSQTCPTNDGDLCPTPPLPIPDRDLTTFYLSPGIPSQFYFSF